MKRFVLDASIALAWFIDRPIAPYALSIQKSLLAGDRAVVPPLWRVEVANGFVVTERRGVLTPSDTAQALQTLQILFAQAVDESQPSAPIARVVATARESQLTAYDAEYLMTASTLQLPLATLDRALGAAALKSGVPLFQ